LIQPTGKTLEDSASDHEHTGNRGIAAEPERIENERKAGGTRRYEDDERDRPKT
jgi:hypothetical protein